MLNAFFWGGLATGTLLIGMVLAYRDLVGPRWTGLIMAFGSGAMISAVAYQLVLGAAVKEQGRFTLIGLGLAIGAFTFYFADKWVDHLGGEKRLDMEGGQASGSGTGILLGSLLDGVPESLVLGLSLVHTPQVSLSFIFAVAISNVPQGLGGTAGMLSSGWPRRRITRLWLAVCALSILAAGLGYALGQFRSDLTGSLIDAFAAGALLVMLTDSMIPESFKHGGNETGLSLTLGFSIAVAMMLAQLAVT